MSSQNGQGYDDMPRKISISEFTNLKEDLEYVALDVRDYNEVIKVGYIPKSINISMLFQFETWTSLLLNKGKKILVVGNEASQILATYKLLNEGFKVKGFLDGGFDYWLDEKQPIEKLKVLLHNQVPNYLETNKNHVILDVREKNEWEQGVLPNSVFISLGNLEKNLKKIPKEKEIVSLCGSGIRSQMATTVLNRYGFKYVMNMEGGIKEVIKKGVKLMKYIPK